MSGPDLNIKILALKSDPIKALVSGSSNGLSRIKGEATDIWEERVLGGLLGKAVETGPGLPVSCYRKTSSSEVSLGVFLHLIKVLR